MTDTDKIRLDKWLWAARFFKTRSLAAEAIEGGKVFVDGERAKASRTVRIGQRLDITLGGYPRTFYVRILSERRGPASVAQTLYEETEDSAARYQTQRQYERDTRVVVGARPDKQDRRLARQFKRTSS